MLIGVIEYQEAKRLRSLLEERKINIDFVSNPESCTTGGCKVTVEVHAKDEDLPAIQEFFNSEQARLFAGLEFDPAILEEVYDPGQENAKCPACGTQFSTQAKECPDCGLVFVVT